MSVDSRGTGEVIGAYYTFDISIQNDGSRAERFKVRATGTASGTWTVTYSQGAANITAAIVAGTFQTPALAPGATTLIHARITIKNGGNMSRLVTIRSVADPTKVDAVRFATLGTSPSATAPAVTAEPATEPAEHVSNSLPKGRSECTHVPVMARPPDDVFYA